MEGIDQENYEELLDKFEDEAEENEEIREGQAEAYASVPEPEEKQTIYNWFWKVVRLKKPLSLVKVGNLSHQEIGDNSISVRDALNLQLLGEIFGHTKFGDYFANVAKITSASSMAKKGWFMDLSISQKKVRERTKQSPSQTQKESWRIFGKKKPAQE